MHDYEDVEDFDETVSDKQLSQLIDEWLAAARPERYRVEDKDWMDAVVAKARDAMRRYHSIDDAIADAARRRVYQHEGQATKRANKELRNIAQTGQLPIGWGEGDQWHVLLAEKLSLPLSIAGERVRLGAASASDLEQWELENHREADKRAEAERLSRTGAQMLARWMLAQQVQRVEDLRVQGGAA